MVQVMLTGSFVIELSHTSTSDYLMSSKFFSAMEGNTAFDISYSLT